MARPPPLTLLRCARCGIGLFARIGDVVLGSAVYWIEGPRGENLLKEGEAPLCEGCAKKKRKGAW